MNYYNENDPKAAAWLRELIREKIISEGVVDERSILDVRPRDLDGYNQCHFFAGIGGWSYALRLAGIQDDEPVWTGSCPCQPFSNAGKQLGTTDARHLWPVFFSLIRQCGPAKVFGEQVASKDGRLWLAGVFADLERMGYRRAGADLCAAGIGAPHIRQRLFWVGVANSSGWDSRQQTPKIVGHGNPTIATSTYGGLAHTDGGECRNGELQRGGEHGQQQKNGFPDRLEYPASNGRQQWRAEPSERSVVGGCGFSGMGNTALPTSARLGSQRQQLHGSSAWSPATALRCADGKARRIESGTFPLAHGVSGRVGLLRGYGNAIVPQVATEFIQAFYEALHDVRSDVLMSDPMF